MRHLVTLETITELKEIPGADAIEAAKVRGWYVVVKKGEFAVGDEVVYFEIDSFLPVSDPRFSFLEPRGVKVQDGITGHVLRTIRLRGQYSQGLILPVSEFPEGLPEIVKYDPPIPDDGKVEGQFPIEFAPKTDAERVQNLERVLPEILNHKWTATEKIDGTSTTYINDNGTLRICSRNWEVSPNSQRGQLAEKFSLMDHLPEGYTLQGEMFGEGIQSNPLRIKGVDFKAFTLYRRTENGPVIVPFDEWPEALAALRVPVLDLELPDTVEGIVEQSDGIKSVINPERRAEGIVWQSEKAFSFLGFRSVFKAISNEYLTKLK